MLLDLVDRTNLAIGKFVSFLIWIGIIIVVGEVIARYLFGLPTVWGPAYTQRIFSAYFVLVGAFTLIQGGHVRVDLLLNSRSPRQMALLDLINFSVLVIWSGALTYESWYFLADSWVYSERDDSALGHPMWPVKLSLFAGVALITLQGCVEIARSFVLLIYPHSNIKRRNTI